MNLENFVDVDYQTIPKYNLVKY